MNPVVHKSKQDDSVNFVTDYEPGKMESRYVRRTKEKMSIYLSSQTGCAKKCRMCHLTATKQFLAKNVHPSTITEHAELVCAYYNSLPNNKKGVRDVHFNFMAQGEPLANPEVDSELLEDISRFVPSKAYPRFLISTIMPLGLPKTALRERFSTTQPEIYYSIYSTDPLFRKKWLPNAMPVAAALDLLADWQEGSRKLIKLHWAFIKGENDSFSNIKDITKAANSRNLRYDVNIVRYNPFSEEYGYEPDENALKDLVRCLEAETPDQTIVQLVGRVGNDVKASCGTFFSEKEQNEK
jgi:adenine C2-methylase RlmN of 23S rRNA A2503 and tRNA A37